MGVSCLPKVNEPPQPLHRAVWEPGACGGAREVRTGPGGQVGSAGSGRCCGCTGVE